MNAGAVADRAMPEQLSSPRLVALHLVPGALVTAAYVALAPVVEAAGFPPIAALLAAIVVVLVPIELGIVLRAVRQDGFDAAVPYRRPLPGRDWAWLVPVLIVAAFIGFGVHMLIEPWLIERLFGWLPAWFVAPIPLDHLGDYSRAAWVATLVVFFVLNGFVGPIVEELYFRGYLLPSACSRSTTSGRHGRSWRGSSGSDRRSTRCTGSGISTSGWSSTAA